MNGNYNNENKAENQHFHYLSDANFTYTVLINKIEKKIFFMILIFASDKNCLTIVLESS